MKHLLIGLLLVFSIVTTNANDAFLGSRGGNVFPIIRNESIRMVKEEIKVVMEKDSCRVYCKFWFKNLGTKAENVFMGFPDYFEDISQGSNPLRNFTCAVNGQETEFDKRTQTTEVDNIPDLKRYEKWFCWNVQFKPGETVLVENNYNGDLGGSADGTCSFSYLIGTAQTWSSTIANGKVIFDYSKIASKSFVDTTFYSDRTLPKGLERNIYNDSTVFSYNNYLPKWNETLKVNLLCFWKCPYGELQKGLTEYPFQNNRFKSPTFSKQMLRLMRNEVFARHGYVFKDLELQNYFAAMSWYKADRTFNPNQLNEFELLFLKYIKDLEENKFTN
jgi:hypothetical protein